MKSYFNLKKVCLYLFIFMNIAFVLSVDTVAMTKEEGIIKTIKSTDAVVEEINVNAYVNMDKIFTQPSKGEEICFALAEKLAVKKEKIENASTKENTHVYLTGEGKNKETICIILQSSEDEDVKETNIVINRVDHQLKDLSSESEKIREALADYGEPKVNVCLIGSFRGKLNSVQKEEILKSIKKNMDASEKESFRDKNMISITSLSSKIKEYTTYGGKKVNLHIALRYNSYEDKTNIWIGTPFITIPY
ncbi:MAG: YwmB family TATA-box binding protein [Marinisporobacter sp.]|nr:YwmB family TATA-box binding protein [Marinisporobacter sp.]